MMCAQVPRTRAHAGALPCRRSSILVQPRSLARCQASREYDRTAALRQKLSQPKLLLGPCCHDGLSARLIERANFDFAFMSGFCTVASRLGAPDTGIASYYEMLDQGRSIHEATRRLPIIGDADTGYGNAVNVKRTVRGYAAAGFAGILIEDQVWPKSCGHVRNKAVVPRAEAVARIRAACDARDEGRDIVVVARTDSRQAAGLDEALERAAAFAAVGADIVFVDALESVEEMRALCAIGGVHKMANMLEGGGKTPVLPPSELEALGFDICAYPLSLLGVSVRAMEEALLGLKQGRVPQPPQMPTFTELQEVLGFPDYWEEEARYAVPSTTVPSTAVPPSAVPSTAVSSSLVPPPPPLRPSVSPDSVEEPGSERTTHAADAHPPPGTIDLALVSSDEEGRRREQYSARDAGAGTRSQWLRVRIADARSGLVKLDTRFPAGFLGSVAAFVPAVAGVDLEGLVRQAAGADWDASKPLLDFESGEDVIQVFLEMI